MNKTAVKSVLSSNLSIVFNCFMKKYQSRSIIKFFFNSFSNYRRLLQFCTFWMLYGRFACIWIWELLLLPLFDTRKYYSSVLLNLVRKIPFCERTWIVSVTFYVEFLYGINLKWCVNWWYINRPTLAQVIEINQYTRRN